MNSAGREELASGSVRRSSLSYPCELRRFSKNPSPCAHSPCAACAREALRAQYPAPCCAPHQQGRPATRRPSLLKGRACGYARPHRAYLGDGSCLLGLVDVLGLDGSGGRSGAAWRCRRDVSLRSRALLDRLWASPMEPCPEMGVCGVIQPVIFSLASYLTPPARDEDSLGPLQRNSSSGAQLDLGLS